jgi:hypothetical protein
MLFAKIFPVTEIFVQDKNLGLVEIVQRELEGEIE